MGVIDKAIGLGHGWGMKACRRYFTAVLSLGGMGMAAAVDAGDKERFELVANASGVTVHVDGALFAEYVVGQGNKPFLYPVLGPDGLLMTRSFPMEEVEGEQRDHPHHRSVWFGHQGVGGFDTWSEALTVEERVAKKKTPEEQEQARREGLASLGATVHREFVKVAAETDRGIIVTRNDYVDSAGKKLLADTRTHVFRAPTEAVRTIDVEITFSAPYGPVRLQDLKDAGFSVRVATPLAPDAKQGAVLLNSEGQRDKDAWGKRAKWCGYSGELKGQKVGVALLNHPASWRYPTPWHARTYGLLTANPFGLKAIAGEEKPGDVELQGSETITLRHRIVFHRGDTAEAGIEKLWEAYAAEP